MRVRFLLAALATVIIISPTVSAAPFGRGKVYREALNLYENGHYQGARNLFESIQGDAVADGYVTLCALKMRAADSGELLESYRKAHPKSSLINDVLFASAVNLFDDGRYEETVSELGLVDPGRLLDRELPGYWFKKGFSEYMLGRYPESMACFSSLEALPMSDLTSMGYYVHGIMLYNEKRFAEAVPMFRKSIKDPRFADLSRFYIVDCEFNRKNYDFVINEGEAIYASAPKERREHLARIISESYLVKGDKEKAREYFEGVYQTDLTRSDFFYSGEVLYAVEDYRGAIEQFNAMTDRTDSLGQIANYHLGNAYVRTRNKVAAMNAFKDASSVTFDRDITEDALFNYAKLAFDLNKDTGVFAEYISRYSTKTKGELIYTYMALANLYDRDYDGAVAAYDNIDELTDELQANYTKANFLRAEQLMNNGSYSDAIPFLRTAGYYLDSYDRFGQLTRYWLAESYYRTEKYADAEKNYLDLYNSDALYDKLEGKVLAYNLAYSCFKQEDYESAAKWFDTYVNSGDGTFRKDARYRRADCDFYSANYKSAVTSYQKVMDEYPPTDDLYCLYKMAMAQGLSNKKNDKVKTLAKAESADPSTNMYSECLLELGKTRCDLKSYSAAVQTFSKLRDTASNDIYAAGALLGLGKAQKALNHLDDALESYKQVVSLLPGSEYAEEATKAIEAIYKSRKQMDKFNEYMEQNSIGDTEDGSYKENMNFRTAEQIYKSGDFRQAVTTLLKYLDEFPGGANNVQAKYYLADSYRELQDKEKAGEFFRQVAESGVETPFSEKSRFSYADITYGLERFAESFKAYSSVFSSARTDASRLSALTGMMRSAFKGKDFSSAIEAATGILSQKGVGEDLKREAGFVKAKSLFSTSRRDEALSIFKTLAANPSTSEGAEARYLLMTDAFDKADFEDVEGLVYDFANNYGKQSYWLAKAYLLLGDSFVERGMYTQAKATYESIRDGYESAGVDDIEDNVLMKLNRLAELMK